MTVEAPARPDRTTQELDALIEEARRRARRRRIGYAAGLIAVLLALGGALLLGGGEDANQAADEPNARSSATAEAQDVLFVRAIADSREGVFAIDTSSGEINRLHVRVSCGDTPFCLISTGGELVISSVGRTTTYDSAAPARDRIARVGNGWITIPSTTNGHVWLGILASGKLGGPHRRGLSAVREVDLEGHVLQSMRPPKGMWPVGAVDSGLLFQYGRGLRLWSLEERGFTTRFPGAVLPAAISEDLVASRGDQGSEFLLTDTRTGEVTRVPPPAGYRWLGYEGAFNPDGSRLALSIARGAGKTLAVVDTRTLDAQVIPHSAEVDPIYAPKAWSSNGDRLFFVGEDGAVMSYRVGSDSLTTHAKFKPNDIVLQMVSVGP
jgi:hypothetical protein